MTFRLLPKAGEIRIIQAFRRAAEMRLCKVVALPGVLPAIGIALEAGEAIRDTP